jgi:hypothetical protein
MNRSPVWMLVPIALFAMLPSLFAQVRPSSPQTQPPVATPGQPNQNPAACIAAGEGDELMWARPFPCKEYYAQKKPGPAPKRDISGIWDSMTEGGVQPNGVYEFPDDPEHAGKDVPYSAAGLKARDLNKPGEGERAALINEVNDPVDFCEVQGFPRNDLYEFRTIQIVQTKYQVLILNQFNKTWRVIWTDGRELPKNPAPTWDGYAVGKWEDDYTFVATYIGMDPRTWLDNVGRPHSAALKVEERWHRVNSDALLVTVTIDDPAYYTRAWKALDEHILHKASDHHDMYQFTCSVEETNEYNKLIGRPSSLPEHEVPKN